MFDQAQQFIKCPSCGKVGGYTDQGIPGYGTIEDDYLNATTGGKEHREPYNAVCPFCGEAFTMKMIYKFDCYAISVGGSFETYDQKKLDSMIKKQEKASR